MTPIKYFGGDAARQRAEKFAAEYNRKYGDHMEVLTVDEMTRREGCAFGDDPLAEYGVRTSHVVVRDADAHPIPDSAEITY